MPKSKDAFRTISEVADWLDVQPHVLRFWESKFSQVRPVKRAGGRRYYRPNDMLLIGGIKQLLHDDGMTIKGVQKLLREKGVKEISALSRPIDGDETVLDLKDPAPVTEADLIAEAPASPDTAPAAAEQDVVQETVEQEPITAEQADVPDAEVEAASETTPEEAPEESSEEMQVSQAKPRKPLAEDTPGWELRRKIIARLTEITELEPENRGEIATAVAALAKLQANRQSMTNP